MEKIPTELWVMIVDYFPIDLKVALRLVSQKMKNIVKITLVNSKICLENRSINDKSLAVFKGCRSIRTHFDANRVTPKGIEKLKNVRKLFISGSLRSSYISMLDKFTNLETLVWCDSVTNENVKYILEHHPHLRKLDFRGCGSLLTEYSLKEFPKYPNLKSFSLVSRGDWENTLDDNCMLYFSHLEALDIEARGITDNGLRYLTGLRKLILSEADIITNEGIKYLEKLKFLSFEWGIINSEAYFHMRNIKKLHLYGCNECGEGLKYLTNVKYLSITGTNINDNHLDSLLPFTRMKKLKLYYCRFITSANINKLTNIPTIKAQQCGENRKVNIQKILNKEIVS